MLAFLALVLGRNWAFWRYAPAHGGLLLPGLALLLGAVALRRASWRAGLLAYAAWNAVILALAPPTDWDVLSYHLALPKLYWQAGGLPYLPWLLHSHWPHLMELVYVPFMAWHWPEGAALLHAALCAALVWAVFREGRRTIGEAGAWFAALLLAAQPVLLRLAGTAHSDGALALAYFLSASLLWRWNDNGRVRPLFLAGACAGLCASLKLFGIVPAAALGLWALKRGGRRAWVFWVPLLLLAVPWYLRSALQSGNPVWPFFPSFLGGGPGAAWLAGPFLRSSRWAWPPALGMLLR